MTMMSDSLDKSSSSVVLISLCVSLFVLISIFFILCSPKTANKADDSFKVLDVKKVLSHNPPVKERLNAEGSFNTEENGNFNTLEFKVPIPTKELISPPRDVLDSVASSLPGPPTHTQSTEEANDLENQRIESRKEKKLNNTIEREVQNGSYGQLTKSMATTVVTEEAEVLPLAPPKIRTPKVQQRAVSGEILPLAPPKIKSPMLEQRALSVEEEEMESERIIGEASEREETKGRGESHIFIDGEDDLDLSILQASKKILPTEESNANLLNISKEDEEQEEEEEKERVLNSSEPGFVSFVGINSGLVDTLGDDVKKRPESKLIIASKSLSKLLPSPTGSMMKSKKRKKRKSRKAPVATPELSAAREQAVSFVGKASKRNTEVVNLRANSKIYLGEELDEVDAEVELEEIKRDGEVERIKKKRRKKRKHKKEVGSIDDDL